MHSEITLAVNIFRKHAGSSSPQMLDIPGLISQYLNIYKSTVQFYALEIMQIYTSV